MTKSLSGIASPEESSFATRALALFNPNSGSQSQHAAWLHDLPAAGGLAVAVESGADLAPALRLALRERFDRLVLVGGDGTVSRILDDLGPEVSEFDIAVVPAGTGNDLARSLGLAISDPEAAWNLALNGVASPMDWVALRGPQAGHFVNGITAGFGGRTASDMNQQQKSNWGRLAYWISALAQLGAMPEFDVSLVANGEEQSARCLGFWIMNGRTVGGGFSIVPTALLDDGLVDVVMIPALPMLELLATGVDFSVLGPERAELVWHSRVLRGSIFVKPNIPISLDGDTEELGALEFEVLPQALRMVSNPQQPV